MGDTFSSKICFFFLRFEASKFEGEKEPLRPHKIMLNALMFAVSKSYTDTHCLATFNCCYFLVLLAGCDMSLFLLFVKNSLQDPHDVPPSFPSGQARCGHELQPQKLVQAMNAEPALKVKESGRRGEEVGEVVDGGGDGSSRW